MAEEIELWFHVASENLDDVKLQQLAQVYPQLIGQISSERDKKSSKQSERLDILDHYRYDELSQILASRMKDNGNSFLELDELKRLLEWKMSRGVFRPSLRGLIASNVERAVKELTSKAFSHFENATIKDIADTANVMQSLQILCQLKGVGPATASLILAVAFPSVVPFFADELFAWISLEREDQLEAFLKKIYPKDGKSMRVDKIIGIKYTEVEYKKLYAAVANLRRRLQSPGNNVSASDIEKAAYVVLQGSEVPLLKLPSLSENTGSRRRPAVDIDSSMTDHSKFSTEPTAKTSLKVDEKGGGTQRRSTRNSNRDESPPQLRSSKRRKMSSD